MIDIKNVSFRYQGRENCTLHNINLNIAAGEMVLLTGHTGCGKSTLLKVINGLIPTNSQGEYSGTTYMDGRCTDDMAIAELGEYVGTLYQNPDDQLFAMTVLDEVSFALENKGWSLEDVLAEAKVVLNKVGLGGYEDRSIHELSGGQRQRLALASVLVSKPKILVLDEPVSQLNPEGVKALMQILLDINRENKITIVVVEHRVHELAKYFNRIILMSLGRVIYDGAMDNIWGYIGDVNSYGVREPQYIKLCKLLKLPLYTLDVDVLANSIKKYCKIVLGKQNKNVDCYKSTETIVLKAKDLCYRYNNQSLEALTNASFELKSGEIVAVMGSNGSGKSTLLNIVSTLISIQKGSVELLFGEEARNLQQIAFLRQEPDLMLLCGTIAEELRWGNKHPDNSLIDKITVELGLQEFLQDYPLAMSKGQRLRIVLGSLLAKNPAILLLDEPTTGQDEGSLNDVRNIVTAYSQKGGSVIFCTHDVELAAQIADRVIIMNSGNIVADDTTINVLSNKALLLNNGIMLPPVLELSARLGIGPYIDIKGVLQDVEPTTMGG